MQIGPNQVAALVYAHRDRRPAIARRELYRVIFATTGTATPSQRASLSRMLKRMAEFGLVELNQRAVRLTDRGRSLAQWYADHHDVDSPWLATAYSHKR